MPITIPVEVQIPPTVDIDTDLIHERVNLYAQSLVDEIVTQQSKQSPMSFEELEKCIPLDQAFDKLRAKAKEYYKVQA